MKIAKLTKEEIEQIAVILQIRDSVWGELAGEVARIVDRSNEAYGQSTIKSAQLMAILWPHGIPIEQYHDARCIISILDKIARVITDKDAFGESPWRDVIGYALLAYYYDLLRNTKRER